MTFSPRSRPASSGASALESLLDRRLVIVTGKGGVGKTSVCAALARAAARAGRRVLAVELGQDPELPALLGDRVESLLLDPYEALAEYLELQVGFGALVRRLTGHKGFHQLLEGAPGWRELISVGKVWHLVERADPGAGPDLVVVDAAATGHSVSFLDVPRVAASAVRTGPLHRQALAVEELLRDPERSVLLPVTRPEELASRECVELVERVRGDLGLPIDRIVLNAAETDPGLAVEPLANALEMEASDAFPWRRALENWETRWRRTLHWGERVAEETGLPTVALPFTPLVSGEDLDRLGAALLEEVAP